MRLDGQGQSFRMFLLDEAAAEMRNRGADVIQLTLGLSDLMPRSEILNAIDSATRNPRVARSVYPVGLPDLRCGLAGFYGRLHGIEVPSERVLVDAGTSAIFRNLFQTILEQGDEVLLPIPYYPLYRIAAELAGGRCRHYMIDLDTMDCDMDSVLDNIGPRTRALVLNSPGNPLGNVVTEEFVAGVMEALPENVYIIYDDVYSNMMFDTHLPATPRCLLDRLEPDGRLIVTNSFSKGYRLYTRRIGWCVLPMTLVGPMTVLQQHLRLTADPAAQFGALEALRYPEDVEEVRCVHRERWKYARLRLSALDGVNLLQARGGFYFVLDCRQHLEGRRDVANCMELATDILERESVATVPGADFGMPGALRISLTSSRFGEGVDRLQSYFASRPGSE
ncbi:MAG: aminotransferase class I/II-fold pyridoxal phosphate-dependent enzyme [bacterium]